MSDKTTAIALGFNIQKPRNRPPRLAAGLLWKHLLTWRLRVPGSPCDSLLGLPLAWADPILAVPGRVAMVLEFSL